MNILFLSKKFNFLYIELKFLLKCELFNNIYPFDGWNPYIFPKSISVNAVEYGILLLRCGLVVHMPASLLG